MTGFLLSLVNSREDSPQNPRSLWKSLHLQNQDKRHPARSQGIWVSAGILHRAILNKLPNFWRAEAPSQDERGWGHPEELFQLCYFVMQARSKLLGVRDVRIYFERTVLLKFLLLFLSLVLKFIFFSSSSIHKNIFSYLTASSLIAVKSLLRAPGWLSC